MGLMDILNGMQNGPRGAPSQSGGGSGGMSPITMALLGLLAYKALKHVGGQPGTAPANTGANPDSGGGLGGLLGGLLGGGAGAGAGGLGGLLTGGLGGLLGGGNAGNALSGGLNDLLRQFQDAGHGETANSWVSNEPNQSISPNDLGKALGADQINTMMQQTGMSRGDLLAGLSQHLPELINQLTPNGRPPTAQEMSRLI
jgi:uncharacterized protein YidB (DUF937 family)